MPPDRLLEARKTYAEVAEASRSLSESAAEVERSIAALGRQARQRCDTLDAEHERVRHLAAQVESAADELRWALRRPLAWLFLCTLAGGFWGAMFAEWVSEVFQWLKAAVLSWWAGGPG